jgi:hypothetical protein
MLVRALIARQDAMSRREARAIRRFLSEYIDADAAALAWRHICRRVRAMVGTLPARAAAAIPELAADPDRSAALTALVQNVLTELDDPDDDGRPLPDPPPPEPAPRVTRSRSLAEARAQHARLAARLMDLKGRIAPPSAPMPWSRSHDGARP